MNFFIKPIVWNTNNYQSPSGEKISTGYPHEHGFAHEEWNNSERMRFEIDDLEYRAFHVQHMGSKGTPQDQNFIFFIASHDSVQQLVGIAGAAISLDENEDRRVSLVKQLGIGKFWKDAWSQKTVKEKFNYDKSAFRNHWDDHVKWTPNWICQSNMFLWLEDPITIDPKMINGKSRLITMFSGHQSIDSKQSLDIINLIPNNQRNKKWETLHDHVQAYEIISSGKEIIETEEKYGNLSTNAVVTITARRGQGQFRRDLEKRWEGKCAFSGSQILEILRASHIKAWKDSDDKERLDPCNGLLLAAHIDALFDKGLISFCSSGKVLVSDDVPREERKLLGLSGVLRKKLLKREQEYLQFHRKRYGFQ